MKESEFGFLIRIKSNNYEKISNNIIDYRFSEKYGFDKAQETKKIII